MMKKRYLERFRVLQVFTAILENYNRKYTENKKNDPNIRNKEYVF